MKYTSNLVRMTRVLIVLRSCGPVVWNDRIVGDFLGMIPTQLPQNDAVDSRPTSVNKGIVVAATWYFILSYYCRMASVSLCAGSWVLWKRPYEGATPPTLQRLCYNITAII